jgi:hypothetical protein
MNATDQAPAPVEPVPLPLRVAATLSAVVGVVTTVVAAASAIAGSEAGRYTVVTAVFGVVAGLTLCIGSAMLFHRRRLGAAIVVAACLLPTVVGVFTTGRVQPPAFLLVLATLTVLANWRLLR